MVTLALEKSLRADLSKTCFLSESSFGSGSQAASQGSCSNSSTTSGQESLLVEDSLKAD